MTRIEDWILVCVLLIDHAMATLNYEPKSLNLKP